MSTTNQDSFQRLFRDSACIVVRDVVLEATDSDQRRREKLSRIILNEMYQFVGLLDADGTELESNRVSLDGAGLKLDDICGKPFWETRWWTVSPEVQERLKDAIRRAASGEFVRYDVEIYGQASGEETIIIDFSLIPVFDSSGRVAFLLPEGRNITEKKLAEAEIEHKNQELEKLLDKIRALDELKNQFFANVSHELRTPLSLILGPLERVLGETQLTDLQRRSLEIVRRNASMLLKHVNDLLDVAKMDAGRMVVEYTEVDLAKLVRIVASHFDAIAPQRGVIYVVDAPDTLTAQVDPEKIERVVLNLLSNAFKFVPADGRIRVSLEQTAGSRALISVQDSGPGVPPEMRRTIFERFRQGDGGATRQFGGTGLGLAIARDFIAIHGGCIEVTDAPGGGALFQVELPLRAPEGTAVRRSVHGLAKESPMLLGTLEELNPIAAAPASADDGTSRPLVLVIEDNVEMNRFVTESLSVEFRVESAFDGRQGLERALANPPDLLVTDLMMPFVSGDQLIAEARRRPEMDSVPILVLSAKTDDALRVHLLEHGAQDYVVKPFAAAELLARARNQVMVKRAREVLEKELSLRSNDLEVLARELALRKRQLATSLDETRLARQQAEQASQVKSRFLSLVSHEMNTPLTSICLTLQTVERQGIRPENKRAMDRLITSTRRLRELVGTILNYARVQSGHIDQSHERVDLRALAEEVVEELEEEATRKLLALKLECVELSPFLGDPRLLRLILGNLVSNAVKYTDHGEVEIHLRMERSTLTLVVRDTGSGISPDELHRIFLPFEQLGPLQHKSLPGVGLGLALVEQIVQALGGRIDVTASVGRGSTFTVVLPVQVASEVAAGDGTEVAA
jgi:PAS domain S-box-containing protein